MVITTDQLHHAFSDFVVHLRGKSIQTEVEIHEVSDRVTALETSLPGDGGDGGLALHEHTLAIEPHVAYDRDLPNLTVLFDNVIA